MAPPPGPCGLEPSSIPLPHSNIPSPAATAVTSQSPALSGISNTPGLLSAPGNLTLPTSTTNRKGKRKNESKSKTAKLPTDASPNNPPNRINAATTPTPNLQAPAIIPVDASAVSIPPADPAANQFKTRKGKLKLQKTIRKTRVRVLNEKVLVVVVGRKFAPAVADLLKNADGVVAVVGDVGEAVPVPLPVPGVG